MTLIYMNSITHWQKALNPALSLVPSARIKQCIKIPGFKLRVAARGILVRVYKSKFDTDQPVVHLHLNHVLSHPIFA